VDQCLTDLNCAQQGGTIQTTCVTQVPFVPPPCPDNCTNHGICVNRSDCAKVAKDHKTYKNAKCPPATSCTSNCSNYNQSLVCACFPGHTGANCGESGVSALIAGLAGGAVAAIVVCVVLFGLAVGSGGTYYVATRIGQEDDVATSANPLYEGNSQSGLNPMHDDTVKAGSVV